MSVTRRTTAAVLLTVICCLGAVSCTQVPITGRQQLALVPASQMLSLSTEQYKSFLDEHEVVRDTPEAEMVRRTGERIARAVERYFVEQGLLSHLRDFDWQFNLVKSDLANAWAMPGGRVVIYTGILPLARDEAGLAVIMGHEIAHAVAQHGRERMSQRLMVVAGTTVLSEALSSQPDATRNLFLAAAGLGAELGYLLPYSRMHEMEADRLGIIFMAIAGYDPHEAPLFWERMQEKLDQAETPEFLSTHPSSRARIENLRHLAETEAMRYYRPKD